MAFGKGIFDRPAIRNEELEACESAIASANISLDDTQAQMIMCEEDILAIDMSRMQAERFEIMIRYMLKDRCLNSIYMNECDDDLNINLCRRDEFGICVSVHDCTDDGMGISKLYRDVIGASIEGDRVIIDMQIGGKVQMGRIV